MNKKTLELKKAVLRIYKKWTIIWLAIIFAHTLLIITSLFLGWFNIALGSSTGIFSSFLFLKNHHLEIKDQRKDIKRLEALDQKICEEQQLQTILKEELAGEKARN